jgi:4-carboxymuconolactone decarboxylase
VRRIPKLEPDQWTDDVRAVLVPTLGPVAGLEGRADGEQGRPLDILLVLAHNPKLLGPFLAWAAALVFDGVLPRRDHELLALRTASNCGSAFEWAHHAVYGRAAGITDDEIVGVAAGPGAPGWSSADAALLRAADELHLSNTIAEATWAVLAGHLSPAALVEVPWVVGQYTMLSMIANATEVGIHPGDDPLPAARHHPSTTR